MSTTGFLGTRADVFMDLAIAFFVAAPFLMTYAIRLAARGRYRAHRNLQAGLVVAGTVAVLLLEGSIQYGEAMAAYAQSAYYGTPLVSALPFRAGAVHYVTNQFSYPHMQHKERFIGEVLRVLRPGGRFVMTNIDPWSMNGWVLYRFFPAAKALDYRDFLTAEDFSGMMCDTGFVTSKRSESIGTPASISASTWPMLPSATAPRTSWPCRTRSTMRESGVWNRPSLRHGRRTRSLPSSV